LYAREGELPAFLLLTLFLAHLVSHSDVLFRLAEGTKERGGERRGEGKWGTRRWRLRGGELPQIVH
jgi:hypothetical protein